MESTGRPARNHGEVQNATQANGNLVTHKVGCAVCSAVRIALRPHPRLSLRMKHCPRMRTLMQRGLWWNRNEALRLGPFPLFITHYRCRPGYTV